MAGIVDWAMWVWTDREGRPLGFRFRNSRYRVRAILDFWREFDRWWEPDGREERVVYRVETHDGGLFELDLRLPARVWHLYKAYD